MLIMGAKINNSLEINKKKSSRSSRMGYLGSMKKIIKPIITKKPKTYDLYN